MFPLDIKILIVDDSNTARSIMMKILTKIGFSQFIEASSGNAGLKTLKENPTVAVVFSDVIMPDGDGMEFLAAVKKDASLSHVPFVLATSEGMEETITESVLLGVNAFVVKPVTEESLREALNTAFNSAKAA